VYADTPVVNTSSVAPTSAAPSPIAVPYTTSGDNSHYSLPPAALPPVPTTNQSFGNMLNTSPVEDSPGIHHTDGSRRSVLVSIDDGVSQSREFLRSYQKVWQENTGSAPATPNDNTMDIGAAKLMELQRELEELEDSYETEYGDLSQSVSSNVQLNQLQLGDDEEKENTDPTSPQQSAPPTLDDDDGMVLMRTGNLDSSKVLQEVDHDVVVGGTDSFEYEVQDVSEVSEDIVEGGIIYEDEKEEGSDEELELVFVKEGVYQDPTTGKFYSLK
jgi:hypothetical protein